jgi:hypothetical protein
MTIPLSYYRCEPKEDIGRFEVLLDFFVGAESQQNLENVGQGKDGYCGGRQ